jgi:uncharacterized membrane protein YkoI
MVACFKGMIIMKCRSTATTITVPAKGTGINKLIMMAAALGLAVSALSAHAFSGEQYAKNAKIGVAEARTIALNAYAGTITDEELEVEKGGSGLRYSFDIKNGNATHEVGVDAKTGKVLENSAEGPNPD